ncbi:hypothetical protein DY000_02062663 [Brassica cretica]|uniref:Uncharacterized protein n=1 Tax=Brassica cretica TaxID=69181 RepID=A0ABQ7ASL6_BRACR|nr:hypothetical protein DY000_02062663 [Brassica cretica]
MKGRRWQHRRRRQHRYNQRHVLPSPPRVILCSLAGVFSGVSSTVLHRLHHRYQFSTTVLRRNLRDEIEVDRRLNNDNDSRVQ